MDDPVRRLVITVKGLPALPALLAHRVRRELALRRAKDEDRNNYPLW